jgi:hypothetical protein
MGTALPTLLVDLMIFCPLGPMNFKNSVIMKINIFEYIVMRKMIFSSEKPPKN